MKALRLYFIIKTADFDHLICSPRIEKNFHSPVVGNPTNISIFLSFCIAF
jgi:hypothetical protein